MGYRGEAIEELEVVSLDNTVSVPYGTLENYLMTRETALREPDVREYKLYAPEVEFVQA